jgi:hypothetical protein
MAVHNNEEFNKMKSIFANLRATNANEYPSGQYIWFHFTTLTVPEKRQQFVPGALLYHRRLNSIFVCVGPAQGMNNKFAVRHADGSIKNSGYSSQTYEIAQPIYAFNLPSAGWNLQQYKPIPLGNINQPNDMLNAFIDQSTTNNGVTVGLVYNHDAEGWRQNERVLTGQGLMGGALNDDMQAFKLIFNPKSFQFVGMSNTGNDYLYALSLPLPQN